MYLANISVIKREFKFVTNMKKKEEMKNFAFILRQLIFINLKLICYTCFHYHHDI